jgi:exodeoxyribonuclease VII large subunit
MRLAKGALEQVSAHVVGEVSDCTVKPGYKAVYFTIRDECAVMPCLMWRDAFDRSGVDLRAGVLVEVVGSFTAYPPKGRMQFQARSIAQAGEGVLRLQVAALARRLEAEGLMLAARKRSLPRFPQAIGLVTSPRGKAVHDVIRTLRRRFPAAELVIAGVQVEGDGAASAIVEGLRLLGQAPGVEVVILCRGGGSYEDLMPFNAEDVARAVVSCPVPVVTGIGHEPDTSIADMVADLRASTPTAAAEAVAPACDEVSAQLDTTARLLASYLAHVVRSAESRLLLVAERPVFRDLSWLLAQKMQTLDSLAAQLAKAIPERVRRDSEALGRAHLRLQHVALGLFTHHEMRARSVRGRLRIEGSRVTERASRSLGLAAARLEELSPLKILARGYAVCYDEAGREVIRAATDVTVGERVRVKVASGSLGCLVESVETEA